jgi:hypothetical protein
MYFSLAWLCQLTQGFERGDCGQHGDRVLAYMPGGLAIFDRGRWQGADIGEGWGEA